MWVIGRPLTGEDRAGSGTMGAMPAASVHEIPAAQLPPTARRVLDGAGVDRVLVYSTPLVTRFRRVTRRDGLLLHGAAGWAEAAPFWDYAPGESSAWLASALEGASRPAPPAVRDEVPVNVTIPVSDPDSAAARVRAGGGCATAKVKVADPGVPPEADAERVAAVAEALVDTVGAERARVRVDANAAWEPDEAVAAIRALDRAAAPAGGLEYVEQPCATIGDLADVRRRVDVPVAADESVRRSGDPLAVARAGAADIAVVKVAPLGGISRALEVAASTGLRVVVSSALETSVGLAQGQRAAAALPELPFACGLATAQLLAHDVTGDPLLPVGGALRVREVAPDESLIGAAPLPEGRGTRWLARLESMCRVLLLDGDVR